MGSIAEPDVPTYGTFRYITRRHQANRKPPHVPPPEIAEFGDVRSLPIQNIRHSVDLGKESPYKLNKQGFTTRRYPTALKSPPYTHSSWNHEAILKEIYVPEIEELLKQVTGVKTAFTDQVVIRNSIHTEVDELASEETREELAEFPKFVGTKAGAGGSPAPKVHLDYAPNGVRTHLRKFHTRTTELPSDIIRAEDKLLATGISPIDLKDHYDGPRCAMFSVDIFEPENSNVPVAGYIRDIISNFG